MYLRRLVSQLALIQFTTGHLIAAYVCTYNGQKNKKVSFHRWKQKRKWTSTKVSKYFPKRTRRASGAEICAGGRWPPVFQTGSCFWSFSTPQQIEAAGFDSLPLPKLEWLRNIFLQQASCVIVFYFNFSQFYITWNITQWNKTSIILKIKLMSKQTTLSCQFFVFFLDQIILHTYYSRNISTYSRRFYPRKPRTTSYEGRGLYCS